MDFKIVLLVMLSVAGNAVGQLLCYTCGFSTSDSDQSCLTITNNTRTVDCSMTYCTILRQEFIDPPGVIASFLRGCDDQPDFLNHDIVDPNFRTFYRACTNDLCNIGNGIESVVGGNLSPTPVFEGHNLLVPGTGGATIVKISFIMLLVTVIVNII